MNYLLSIARRYGYRGKSPDGDATGGGNKEKCCLWLAIFVAKKKAPRSFFFVFRIVLPLLCLCCLAIVCGHFLAVFESGNEVDSFLDSMEYITVHKNNALKEINKTVKNAYEDCLRDFLQNQTDRLINGTELMNRMDECKVSGLNNESTLIGKILSEDTERVLESGLQWNRCFYDSVKETNATMPLLMFQNWRDTFVTSYENYSAVEDEYEASLGALEDAKKVVRDSCEPNSAGGAMFWFTVMTTIGYGNAAIETKKGRLLVYTAGFISILLFSIVSGIAGYTFLTMADDFLCRIKLKLFTKGWRAVVLWLFIFWIWIFFSAFVFGIGEPQRTGDPEETEPIKDRIWFAFISLTTIGFGDMHVHHESFLLKDMLTIPILMLMGFVFVANFSIKLTEILRGVVIIRDFLFEVGITDDQFVKSLKETDQDDVVAAVLEDDDKS